METYFVTKDIKTFYVQAASFPMGVGGAHKTLHDMLPSATGRNLMAVSYPDGKQGLIYKAAVEEAFDGEAEKYKCDTFTVRKGKFASKTLVNWRDSGQVKTAFDELLTHPQLDKKGYCLE